MFRHGLRIKLNPQLLRQSVSFAHPQSLHQNQSPKTPTHLSPPRTMPSYEYETLQVSPVDKGVLEVALNRPKSLNAMNTQ